MTTNKIYDSPEFTVTKESRMCSVQSPVASLTDFAHFRSRNKCIVTAVTVHCKSLPSAITTWSLQVMRGATTIAAKTVSAFSVVGDLSATLTLTSQNTLLSAGESISLELDSTEKGKFDVVWEYQNLLPD
jgi:hypothetical protein